MPVRAPRLGVDRVAGAVPGDVELEREVDEQGAERVGGELARNHATRELRLVSGKRGEPQVDGLHRTVAAGHHSRIRSGGARDPPDRDRGEPQRREEYPGDEAPDDRATEHPNDGSKRADRTDGHLGRPLALDQGDATIPRVRKHVAGGDRPWRPAPLPRSSSSGWGWHGACGSRPP